MTSLLRNLPVILLAVLLAVCVYFLYSNINHVSDRLDQISHELYYSINSVNDLTSRLGELGVVKEATTVLGQGTERPLPGELGDADPAFPTVTELVEGQTAGDEQFAESVDSEDIRMAGSGDRAGAEDLSKLAQNAAAVHLPPEDHDSVEHHIDNLANFVKKNEDNESVTSEVSSASALQTRKKVPPYPAKNFDIGHEEVYGGKVFSVIRSKAGVTRWSGAKPISSSA